VAGEAEITPHGNKVIEMKKFMALAVAAALIPASAVMAQPAPKKAGIEAAGYQWNKMDGKTAEALKLKGDAANGVRMEPSRSSPASMRPC
jgi:hypothetical protein